MGNLKPGCGSKKISAVPKRQSRIHRENVKRSRECGKRPADYIYAFPVSHLVCLLPIDERLVENIFNQLFVYFFDETFFHIAQRITAVILSKT